MAKTRYGIISDIHEDPRIIGPAIEILISEGVDKLILNGDIGVRGNDLKTSQDFLAYVLQTAAESELETYAQPGSHEPMKVFHPVLEFFLEKYPNMKNVFQEPKQSQGDHDLLFLPGSDFLCGGEYQILSDDSLRSGGYKRGEDTLYVSNMRDLESGLSDPEKTVIICHVPRRFDNPEHCVDMVYFGENDEGVIPGMVFDEAVRNDVGDVDEEIFRETVEAKARSEGYELKRENRGNKELRSLYERLGINKAVSGHFHESGHRANDSAGNPVPENTEVNELFWNSGCMDYGKMGILSVEDAKASYRNISLLDYVD